MGVQRLEPIAVIDHDGVSVNAEILRQHDFSIIGGFHGVVFGDGQIES